MTLRKKKWIIIVIIILSVLTWRFSRKLNIFVVDDKFAYPIQSAVPTGVPSLRAKDCGVCHQEIYKEWSASIHARAWTEEYFVVDLDFENHPPVCDNCHIQLQNQRDYLVTGFHDKDRLNPIIKPNPDFDPVLQSEGVTCAVCHVRNGKIIGPFGSDLAPHPVTKDPAFLSGISPCKICHVVDGNRWDMFYKRPPCGTLSEISETGKKADCVGCHLPRVNRPIAEGGPKRIGGKHLFQGGHSPEMVKSALTVDYEKIVDNNNVSFSITLTNTGATHNFPTGTPDRQLTLELQLINHAGRVIKEETHTMKRTVMWRPFIIELWDSRLAYNKPQTFLFSLDNDEEKQALFLDVVVRYHLLDEARRKRIGYKNTTPIRYPIYHKKITL